MVPAAEQTSNEPADKSASVQVESPFAPFTDFSLEVEGFARTSRGALSSKSDVSYLLDGAASDSLRLAVPLNARRLSGAFFTPKRIADEVATCEHIARNAPILDPGCGAGDLLLAAALKLPSHRLLSTTLEAWDRQLSGWDLEESFVRAARARLFILAQERSKVHDVEFDTRMFSGIRQTDATTELQLDPITKQTRVLINPPYQASGPVKRVWGSGSLSQAAIFLETVVSAARPNSHVVAVIPDVLRSGSRYQAWRAWVDDRARVDQIQHFGRFSKDVDVDVIGLHLTVRAADETKSSNWLPPVAASTVGQFASVSVGTVVPHRDAIEGPMRSYLHAATLTGRTIFDSRRAPRIRTNRVTFTAPFVVIRRTSAPDDAVRARATVVVGRGPIAVENHLVVVRPASQTLDDCLRLRDVLTSAATTNYLNSRIRCRHLTVQAVREIPFPADAT